MLDCRIACAFSCLLLRPCTMYVLQVSRGGHTVNLVSSSLVIFGGQNANRTLLNDLHILDLETMTWDDFDAV